MLALSSFRAISVQESRALFRSAFEAEVQRGGRPGPSWVFASEQCVSSGIGVLRSTYGDAGTHVQSATDAAFARRSLLRADHRVKIADAIPMGV
jgi:hypothetical protein